MGEGLVIKTIDSPPCGWVHFIEGVEGRSLEKIESVLGSHYREAVASYHEEGKRVYFSVDELDPLVSWKLRDLGFEERSDIQLEL